MQNNQSYNWVLEEDGNSWIDIYENAVVGDFSLAARYPTKEDAMKTHLNLGCRPTIIAVEVPAGDWAICDKSWFNCGPGYIEAMNTIMITDSKDKSRRWTNEDLANDYYYTNHIADIPRQFKIVNDSIKHIKEEPIIIVPNTGKLFNWKVGDSVWECSIPTHSLFSQIVLTERFEFRAEVCYKDITQFYNGGYISREEAQREAEHFMRQIINGEWKEPVNPRDEWRERLCSIKPSKP